MHYETQRPGACARVAPSRSHLVVKWRETTGPVRKLSRPFGAVSLAGTTWPKGALMTWDSSSEHSPSIPAVSPPIVAPMWPHIGLAQGSILVRLRCRNICEECIALCVEIWKTRAATSFRRPHNGFPTLRLFAIVSSVARGSLATLSVPSPRPSERSAPEEPAHDLRSLCGRKPAGGFDPRPPPSADRVPCA